MEEAQSVSSSTWNISMASSSGNCSGQGDLFTSLLLQLSQAHTSQIQKLEHRVEALQKKCSKLAAIANENADVARVYRVHNKELKEENAKLQQQLAELEGQRVGIREENDSSGSDQGGDVAVLVTQPAQQATITSNHKVHPCQQSQNHKLVRPNKLTKGKSKKKIRYAEVDDPSAEVPQGELIGETTQDRGSLQDDERRKNVKITQNKVQESDISGEPHLTDELLGHHRHDERHESKPARILVPETCNPSLEMESSIDCRDSHPNAGGDNSRVKKHAHLPAIPETLAIVGENQNGMESLDHSDFDPPTCASTPLQAPFSQRIDLETLSSQLQGVSRNQGSPECKKTRDEIEFVLERDDHNLRTKSNLELKKDDVAHQHDDTRYASQEKSQRKGRTSLPKSESQYPVDFSSTQVPSPTFCGGNNDDDDDDDEDVGLGNVDDGLHVPVIKQENIDTCIKTTPVHGSSSSHSRYRTPQSILGNDESCQSEASMLLLQAPHATATPKGSNTEENPKSNIEIPITGSNWKANPRKRKFHDEDAQELESENNQALEINQDFENDQNLDKRLRRVSSRSKVDQERSPISDETYLDVSVPDKENSPPKHKTLPQTSTENQDLGFTAEPGKLKVKGGKMLKQSKLTTSMFQSSNKIHNISLIEQYNGNGKVNLDSQRDESLAKAVELSLLASMSSFKNTPNSRSLTGDQQDEFKVPGLPHKKKTPGRTDKGLARSNSIKQQVSSKERGSTSEQHSAGGHLVSSTAENMLESDDIIFDVIDRGGGVSKLSRKKRKTAGRSATREDVRNQVQKVEEVQEVVPADEEDEDNNSCVDMFADVVDDDDEKEEGGALMEDTADERRLPGMSNCHDRANNQSMGTLQIVQEFDRLPMKPEGPGYKYVDIVRKREERQKLKAFDCKQCEAFYRDMKLTDEEKAERMKACSRHRGQFSPPSTPDHYWSIGFPDTQTCLQRGYIKVAESTDEQPRKRRTNKYKQLF